MAWRHEGMVCRYVRVEEGEWEGRGVELMLFSSRFEVVDSAPAAFRGEREWYECVRVTLHRFLIQLSECDCSGSTWERGQYGMASYCLL